MSSIDDFYIIGPPSHMVVMETTNDVYDKRLYDKVSYKSAISYHRVFAANILARSGTEWVEWAKVRSSGQGGQ